MNGLYKSEVDDKAFHALFTDENRDTLKTDCASLLLNAIWQLVTDRAIATANAGYCKNIIIRCKTKLAITFSVLAPDGTSRMKYLPATCGEEVGKGLIRDLLNHTVRNTTKAYASIEFHINQLYFIPGFIPEDLTGMAFTPFKPPSVAAPIAPVAPPVASPATATTGTTAAPAASPLNTPTSYFNVSALPPDVQRRYQLNQAANSVMTSADM